MIKLSFMELLSKLGIDWRLLVWQIVNFGIVLLVLKKFALGPVMRALDERAKKLEQGLRDAEEAKTVKVAAESEREKILAAARNESGRIVAEARKEAEVLREELHSRAKKEVDGLLLTGKNALKAEKELMLGEAKSELGLLVVEAVGKVLSRALTKEDEESLLVAAARELKTKL
ncbi:ATP synthase F0 subunit B [Patescibacteria group bacterium]|nr:MAG: ATP synthase F0 subunit B [Patescibacteria group bacterium]